jgi:hypothetical protein
MFSSTNRCGRSAFLTNGASEAFLQMDPDPPDLFSWIFVAHPLHMVHSVTHLLHLRSSPIPLNVPTSNFLEILVVTT